MQQTSSVFAACAAAVLCMSVAPARATDYWLIADDTQSGGNSSLSGSGSYGGWADAPGGTEKVQFGNSYGAVDPAGVYHMQGHGIRAPFGGSYAFQGRELVFDGERPFVNDKMPTNATLTIGALRVVAGTHGEIRNGDNNKTKRLAGTNWVVEAGGMLGLNMGDHDQNSGDRSLVCSANVSGEGVLAATAGIAANASPSGSVTLTGDLSDFAGVLSAGEKGATFAGTHAEAVTNHSLAIAAPSALPCATPRGLPLRGAVVVTNGATLAFACSATSPDLRGWDFGDGDTPTVDVTDGCTVIVRGPVAGASGLRKTGGGTLVLDAGGAGEFGRMVLVGETNVSAAALADYAAASEALFDRFPDETQPFVLVSSVEPGYRSLRVAATVARTGDGADAVRVLYRVAETAAGLGTAPDVLAHESLAAGADASFAIPDLPVGNPLFVRAYAVNANGVRTGSAIFSAVPGGFGYGSTIAASGYGASRPPVEGLPVLVRIAEGSPAGFSYAQLHSPADGADLAFLDTANAPLPFEIDTWDPDGESLVWVRLPYLAGGTPFEMRWGSDLAGKDVCPENPWRGYAGVWHMGESGDGAATILDSTTNALHAAATAGSYAQPDGRFGGARIPTMDGTNKNNRCIKVDLDFENRRAVVDGINSEDNGNAFTVSMWVRPMQYDGDGMPNFQYLVGRKSTDGTPAWGIQYGSATDYGQIRPWGCEKSGASVGVLDFDDSIVPSDAADCLGKWIRYDAVYSGENVALYANGGTNALAVATGRLNGGPAANGTDHLYLAGTPNGGTRAFCGDLDEVRIRAGAADADWIAADWAAQADPAFLSAGAARILAETGEPAVGLSVAAAGYDAATLNSSVTTLGDGASAADVLVEVVREDAPGRTVWSTAYSVSGPDRRTLGAPRLSVGTAYLARIVLTNSLGASASLGPLPFRTKMPGAPVGTATIRAQDPTGFTVEATASAFGTGATSARMRLEASTSPTFDSITAVSREVGASLGDPATLVVSRLAPATAYYLRVRLVNDWRIETYFPLGSASTQRAVYVDSLAAPGGDGLSPATAFRTIREGIDDAGAHCTVWVRGGPDRSYAVTNETDTLPIPAEKAGLSIRVYGDTPGDSGRAALSVSDSYVEDGNRMHIVSNAAPDVTFAGFTCSYGPRSLGVQNLHSVFLIAVAAPRFTLADCEFFCTGIPGYAQSGANGIVAALQVDGDWHAAAGMTVESCFFHDTTGYRGDTAPQPLLVPNATTIRECVFSNTWVVARDPGPGKAKFQGFTFVSNVVCAGAIRGSATPYFAFPNGLFSSGYGGLGPGAEFAYNVFVGTGEPNRGVFAFARWDGYGGTQRFHHNVVRNFGWVWGYNRNGNPSGKTVAEVFDNVFELIEGGTVVRDEGFDGEEVRVGSPLFVAGSFSRNNALVAPGAFWGGASALADDYDRSVVSALDDIAIADPPDWACTNDIFHADFHRYRSNRYRAVDIGRLGWRGENREYPLWIGAKPPIYPEPALMILR